MFLLELDKYAIKVGLKGHCMRERERITACASGLRGSEVLQLPALPTA